MPNNNLIISPKTRVGELLENYPALEEVLLSISPLFANLKNPVLRRTIARVATLQQAAAIGDISVQDLVNRLRNAAGQEETVSAPEGPGRLQTGAPDWMQGVKIALEFDASSVISKGESPLAEILKMVRTIEPGTTLLLKTPFVPAPIIDKLQQMGYLIWVSKQEIVCLTYIYAPYT